jgi:hypothetical protein
MDVCHLLACLGRGLCDGLITRPEESYRVWSQKPRKGPYVPDGNLKENEWMNPTNNSHSAWRFH